MALKLITLASLALMSLAVRRPPIGPAPLTEKQKQDESTREAGRQFVASEAPDMSGFAVAEFLHACETYARELGHGEFYESFYLDVIRHRLPLCDSPDDCWKAFCLS